MYRAAATLAFLLLVAGWTQRRRRARHVPLVLAGIVIDLAIVVALELERDVVAKSVGETWSTLQAAHIGASSLAVLLYLPVVGLGVRLLRPGAGPVVRAWHRRIATTALGLRTLGFLCMWAV